MRTHLGIKENFECLDFEKNKAMKEKATWLCRSHEKTKRMRLRSRSWERRNRRNGNKIKNVRNEREETTTRDMG